jgi:hypothetical protein
VLKAPVAPDLLPRLRCDVDLGFEAATRLLRNQLLACAPARVWQCGRGFSGWGLTPADFPINVKNSRVQRNSKQGGCCDQMDEYSMTGSVEACPFGEMIVKVLGRI